jgi:hypothetical protein
MANIRLPKIRFTLKSLLVLILGIAIGYSLNLQTWKLLTGHSPYASLPLYTIAPPDVLKIDVTGNHLKSSSMTCLVAPDGRVNLGESGLVYVSGMIIEEAQFAIEKKISKAQKSPRVLVDVYAHNSKTYYVIFQPIGGPSDVVVFPITGNETVLDAIAQVGGVTFNRPLEISVSRPPPTGVGTPKMLKVDWDQIAGGKSNATNYPIYPCVRIIITEVPNATASN